MEKKVIRLTENGLRQLIGKACHMVLIEEGAEYNRERQAKRLIRNYFHIKNENDTVDVLNMIRRDIPNVRMLKAKYLPGVVRLIGLEQLDSQNYDDINDILETILSNNGLIQKYDSDFNGLYFEELQFELFDEIQKLIASERFKLSQHQYPNNGEYSVIPISNFNEAKQYSPYTDWCITKTEFDFQTYTMNGQKFYFCLKNGFENLTKPSNPSTPKDNYGLSMIAVSISRKGRLASSTTRWNEGVPGNKTLDIFEISQLIGRNFYDCIG